MAAPKIRHITDAWLDFGEFKVCSHWAEFDAVAPICPPNAHALYRPDSNPPVKRWTPKHDPRIPEGGEIMEDRLGSYSTDLRGDTTLACASYERALSVLGWNPKPQVHALQMPDGSTRPGVSDVDAEGNPVATRLRSYIGVIIENGDVQLQVRGRLRRGEGKLAVELETFPG